MKSLRTYLAFACVLLPAMAVAERVAGWGFAEASPPFADRSGNGIALMRDAASTTPMAVNGTSGGGIFLDFRNPPGLSTRLTANGTGLQSNSFGFSFWINPVAMHSGDHVLAKEMQPTGGPDFAKVAWKLQVGPVTNDTAPLELVVRGTHRSSGDFFGSVSSVVKLPLQASRDQWFHIAGGYDSVTGELRLFVNGTPAIAHGTSGANNSDGGGIAVGTVRNNGSVVGYAALACLDELDFYDVPPDGAAVEAMLHVPSRQANLLGFWKLDETTPPYADAAHKAAALSPDTTTTPPLTTTGVRGNAVRLRWLPNPGVSTRIAAYGPQVQSNSFGFSFWLRPVDIAPGDNFLGKEMMSAPSGSAFTKVAWSLRAGSDDGTGHSPLEFVVRGADRGKGDFFGNVVSALELPLHQESGTWHHIAGGYDAVTGRLELHIDGSESFSQGTPGAFLSDGGALVLGTMVNGASQVLYAAIADIDAVQLYDGPLWFADVARLMSDPDDSIAAPLVRSFQGSLVAHWKLNEPGPWYGDWSGNQNNLERDNVTAPPVKTEGVDGEGILMQWRPEEGIATRLYAQGAALQTDSFGFSFWIKPTYLSTGDNIIAKEMAPDAGADFTRFAWQVQVGQDHGSGSAPLELVVRGGDRSNGNFFGSVYTTATVPLHATQNAWVHVAGGYDAASGVLCIYLDGQSAASQGRPGAKHADGSWISVGSVRNGLDFVRYGAIAGIDDIQLYNAPLSPYEVAWLRKFPGEHIDPDDRFVTTSFRPISGGGVEVSFQSGAGMLYHLEASTGLKNFLPVSIIEGSAGTTTVRLSKAQLDTVLGNAPRPRLFIRVGAMLPDVDTGDVGFSAATITPSPHPEAYVPQYHFSWKNANVGDPTGLLRYQGKYHIFTWDHGVSDDLLSWDSLGWPMSDGNAGSGFWTGSVVVDKTNTSGFSDGTRAPMVAIYTIHDNATAKESVGISYSSDQHDFHTYAGNPVISTPDLVYRDPDVFWHEPTQKWILLVARSAAKQIQFYGSPDLKSWTHLSDFGPVGASNEIWEVPGLAEVPIDGMGNHRKWLLHVGAGTNKVQYFTGNFDGTSFTMDDETRGYLENGDGLPGSLLADFEGDSYASMGWTVTGDAFGSDPVPRWFNQPAQSHLGQRLASSYRDGDWRTGSSLTSSPFNITRNCINFLIGGGNHPGKTCMDLIVDGAVVRTATGDDSNVLRWAGWDVSDLIGLSARLRIVDDEGGFWGRIYVDQIMTSDVLMDHHREHANWVEMSPDFFAPKFVRDFDNPLSPARWMGWVGSWEYEANRPQPQGWGKGVESLFRNVTVERSATGWRLVQKPVVELQKLRGPQSQALPRVLSGVSTLTEFQPTTNAYELQAEFDLSGGNTDFGLNLCVNPVQRVVVGYNKKTSNLYIDRSSSGYVSLSPSFPRTVSAPLVVSGSVLKLRIYVDQSSIEVFGDDGRQVLTSQIYPDVSGTGIELFSRNGATTLRSLRAWPLAYTLKP